MHPSHDNRGFTLVELLVALVVTSVILSAVAALAFAMTTSSNIGEDRALSQARLRQTMLRLRDLIGNAKLVCAAPGDDLVIWEADTNTNGAIDVDEVVYLERGADHNMLRLCRFQTAGSYQPTLADLADPGTKASLIASYAGQFTLLLPDCDNVSFTYYQYPSGDRVARTKRVTITLDLTEDDGVHRYEIDAALRAWAGHLLSADGTAVVSDDD